MALLYSPQRWHIVICDFDTGFEFPEMVKKRPVVIVSERFENELPLCRVVPLSATEPKEIKSFHYKMHRHSLPDPFKNHDMWAKCDMIYTVALSRLDRVKIGKDRITGKRLYANSYAIPCDIVGIKEALLHGLRMGVLTDHL